MGNQGHSRSQPAARFGVGQGHRGGQWFFGPGSDGMDGDPEDPSDEAWRVESGEWVNPYALTSEDEKSLGFM